MPFRQICFLILYSISLPCLGQTQEVSFITEKQTDTVFYHAISASVADVELDIQVAPPFQSLIKLKKDRLLTSKDTLYQVIGIPSILLDSIDASILFKDHIQAKFDYGNSKTAYHDSSYVYSLPIRKGKRVRISQGFNGKQSHSSTESKYAIDFDIPVGSKVYAAREGIVVYTLDQFTKSGGKTYVKKANKIVILHSDGTFAAYSHLQYKGTLVKKGERVERGQHIGYSGNTGFSRGPHLHFAVRLPQDICVPIYFEGYEGQVFKKGDYVKRRR